MAEFTSRDPMSGEVDPEGAGAEALAPDAGGASRKDDVLLTIYRATWDEMSWRRTAGYRTIILGLGYFGILLAVLGGRAGMPDEVRRALAGVVAIGTVFGAGYLVSNWGKYMAAAARLVRIEDYLGAFRGDFLGAIGPLMPLARRAWPGKPLYKDVVSMWSIIAFAAGGLLTAAVILF